MAQGFQGATFSGSADIADIGIALMLQAWAGSEHLIAETVTLAEQQQLLIIQVIGLQKFFGGKRMIFGHQHHKGFVVQRLGYYIRLDKG